MKLVHSRQHGKLDSQRHDMLAGFIAAKTKHPDTVDDTMVLRYTMTNIISGSDTTSIAMTSILYNILKSPTVLTRLRAELDAANLTYPPDFRTASALPYLNAVIREGLRIHPVIGFSSERIVPPAGLHLPDGRRLPPGAVVAMSAWITHFDTEIYGVDAADFRPERWLRGANEDTHTFEERLAKMNRADLTFSVGPRACLGKHIGRLEIWETVPTLVACFEMDLVESGSGVGFNSAFFVKFAGVDVKIRWREGVDKEALMGTA